MRQTLWDMAWEFRARPGTTGIVKRPLWINPELFLRYPQSFPRRFWAYFSQYKKTPQDLSVLGGRA